MNVSFFIGVIFGVLVMLAVLGAVIKRHLLGSINYIIDDDDGFYPYIAFNSKKHKDKILKFNYIILKVGK